LRTLPPDITGKIKLRFKSDYKKALELLSEYVDTFEHINSDRVLRCILFLSENTMESFTKNLEAAKTDTRDVMWWAEYNYNSSLDQSKLLRDFNCTFKDSKIKI